MLTVWSLKPGAGSLKPDRAVGASDLGLKTTDSNLSNSDILSSEVYSFVTK